MVPRGRRIDRIVAALSLLALGSLACAGDNAPRDPVATAAPMVIPHAANLAMTEHARRRNRPPGNVERQEFLTPKPGLRPVTWPSNNDALRASLLTPTLKSTPVFGWIAENLYRDKKDNGWSVELESGEYQVLYRYHLKK